MHSIRKWISGGLAATALATVAVNAAQNEGNSDIPGVVDASRVTGGTYATDPAHTLVGWRVNHFGFNDYFGIFGDVEGTLMLDPAKPEAAQLSVTIPIANVTVASDGLKDHLLRAPKEEGASPDFFGPEPEAATYQSTAIVVSEDGMSAQIDGNLTMNGVTKPVMIDATFTGAGANPFNKKETIGFEGTATIARSDFNISYGLPVVSDEVELEITAAFEKAE